MKRLCLAILLLAAMCLPASAGEITVFAAASLTDALSAMKPAFEKKHPGEVLTLVFAASGALLDRMGNDKACDVFVSADMETMDAASDRQRIDPASRVVFAGNALVLATPAGNPSHVTGLDALSRGGVRRIGVGNPESVPAGRYAQRALQKEALWFALTSKLVYYPSVRHVLTALEKGSLDAGFVYATDAAIAGKTVAVAATIPLSPPIIYPAAIAATADNRQGATTFLAYLTSPEARETLARFGFTNP